MEATGVVIAGYDVNKKNWKDTVWGNPPHQLGRVPMGLAVALREQAGVIIFGGGGSHSEISGQVEARHTIAYLYDNWDDLYEFGVFQGCRRALDLLKRRLENGAALPETNSGNTEQEVRNALELCAEYRLARAIVVSSADHVCRCLQNALTLTLGNGSDARHRQLSVSAEAAHTMYSTAGIQGVMVRENQEENDWCSTALSS